MNTKLLVDRFLSWPLPESLCSDPCASMPGYPHRTGTNLMTAEQAEAMIEYVISTSRQPEGEGLVIRALEHNGITVSYRLASPYELRNGEPLVRLSDAQRAFAELRDQLLKSAEQSLKATELLSTTLSERDTLRQQLAERDATIARLEAGIPRIQEQSHQMRQQRDKLAQILRDLVPGCKWRFMRPRIDQALQEVDGGD